MPGNGGRCAVTQYRWHRTGYTRLTRAIRVPFCEGLLVSGVCLVHNTQTFELKMEMLLSREVVPLHISLLVGENL